MLRWVLESPYLAMRELSACFAVSYDISSRNRNKISLSFISITSSRLNPLIVPSSFTSCTIRRTLWVNLPMRLLEPPARECGGGRENKSISSRVMRLVCINLSVLRNLVEHVVFILMISVHFFFATTKRTASELVEEQASAPANIR